MPDGDSFAGGTYPTPPEIEERHIIARVFISFDIEDDFPITWDIDDIKDYICKNIDDYDWFDKEIDDVEV